MEANFKDRERLNLPPDLEGITRPKKDAKTVNPEHGMSSD